MAISKYTCISQSVQPNYLKLGYLTNSCDLYTYIIVLKVCMVRTWAYTFYTMQICIHNIITYCECTTLYITCTCMTVYYVVQYSYIIQYKVHVHVYNLCM